MNARTNSEFIAPKEDIPVSRTCTEEPTLQQPVDQTPPEQDTPNAGRTLSTL